MFMLKPLTSEDIALIAAEAESDPMCERMLKATIQRYVRRSGYVPRTWVRNEKVGSYLFGVVSPIYIASSKDTYAVCVAGRLYRIRVDFAETSEIYFSDSNPPGEDVRAYVESLIVDALKVHGQFGFDKGQENPNFRYYRFVARPDSETALQGL